MQEIELSDQGYSMSELKSYVQKGEIEEAKKYVLKYFIKIQNPMAVLKWVPSLRQFLMFSDIEVKKNFLIPSITNGDFGICKWFFTQNEQIYIQCIEPNKPRTFTKNGELFLNTFSGYKHLQHKKYKEYSSKIKEKVKFIWKHIYEVWCSKNKQLFKYVKSWLANMISGRKMETCLYLKSGQGTGKTIITDFIQREVLGNEITYSTNDIKCILGNFNEQLKGKVLLILEELPAISSGQWSSLSNALKHIITGKTFEIHEKYKPSYTCTNCISVIINTNNNAIKIETDDRRVVVLDLSNDRVGDREYFNKLAEYTTSNVVGKAFYSHCKKIAKKSIFNESILPLTESKKDLIVDSLPSLFGFIKDTYVAGRDGINKSFKTFYEEYESYCASHGLRKDSKIIVSKKLKTYKIPLEISGANNLYINIDGNSLLHLYQTNNWIHEVDEIYFNDTCEDKVKQIKTGKHFTITSIGFIDEEGEKIKRASELTDSAKKKLEIEIENLHSLIEDVQDVPDVPEEDEDGYINMKSTDNEQNCEDSEFDKKQIMEECQMGIGLFDKPTQHKKEDSEKVKRKVDKNTNIKIKRNVSLSF